MKTNEKIIYLTFDDGPVPEMTPDVLRVLKEYNAKATFFCVGHNVKKYTEVFEDVVKQGHAVANHTYNHLNGAHTDTDEYVENVYQCRDVMGTQGKQLFRPAYGRLTKSQQKLLKDDFEIVMWSVLAGDFDNNLSKEDCLNKLLKNTTNGSIVVMHDNPKFYEKVMWVLPQYLDYFTSKGYRFECL